MRRAMSRLRERLKAALAAPLLALGLGLGLAPAAHAMGAPDCAPEDLAPVEAWLQQHPWHVGATRPDAQVAAACRLWPHDKRLLIVAVAYAQDQERDRNLVVALVDTGPMAVAAAFQGVLLEDETWSLDVAGLRIDTAPWDLAPGVRAFGVDVLSPALDAPVRHGITGTRSLFVQEGDQLRMVLDGFVLTTAGRSAKGATSAKVSLSAHRSHGYADLLVTRKAEPPSTTTADKATLVYDGARYDGAPGFVAHQVAPQGAARRP